jgi:hypothetical protein
MYQKCAAPSPMHWNIINRNVINAKFIKNNLNKNKIPHPEFAIKPKKLAQGQGQQSFANKS